MNIDFFGLASFVLVATFTPGPSNISSASMGILNGYRKTLPFLSGILGGFFLVMLLCGLISSTLLRILPGIENILRYLGAAFILWLAYHTLKASYTFEEDQQALLGFPQGFLLQLVNPPAIIYGLTLYSTFLGGLAAKPIALFVSAVAVAIVGFAAVSTWTLFGTAIRTYLDRPRIKQVLNTALSLLLAFTAVELSGVLDLLFA
jgi:cysteine/O-acetylserine efflux protein